MSAELPPLPKPFFSSWERGGFASTDGYTDEQMRAYASAAVAAATQAMEAELAKLRADLEAMLPLLVDAESSLTDYQEEVMFGPPDVKTLSALREAIRAHGIT